VPSQHQTASTQDAERIREHIRKVLQKLSERRRLKASWFAVSFLWNSRYRGAGRGYRFRADAGVVLWEDRAFDRPLSPTW